MSSLYRHLVRPLLFRLDAEKAHDLAVTGLSALSRATPVVELMRRWNQPSGRPPVELFGLSFPNAVGLAAGMDKNGRFWRAGAALGFGHVEVGTVTAKPQDGNPRPRLFRFPKQEAVLNRMGFNNLGAEALARTLRASGAGKPGRKMVLGVNLGKSKVTPLEEAAEDYLFSFRTLADFADYITINVSSPNTPGLRQLQNAKPLEELLAAIQAENQSRADRLGRKRLPVLLKIAPDLTFAELDDILAIAMRRQLAGLIATNTTLRRPGVPEAEGEAGGLSGRPLHPQSLAVVRFLALSAQGRLPIIGVGGIRDAASAGRMLDAGASLIQVYSSLIYEGPFLPARLARAAAPALRPWA